MVGDKTVTIAREGENKDKLKVRVGSSWFAFDDYMMQAKTRMERDAAEEEADDGTEPAAAVDVSALLEVPSSNSSSNASTPRAAAKKKKKKKAKKKASAAELDLDMDNDDAAE